jgi:hypothetical protein
MLHDIVVQLHQLMHPTACQASQVICEDLEVVTGWGVDVADS